MPYKHEIHLIPSVDGKGVLAYVPGPSGLMCEAATEEDALAGIKEAIEEYHGTVRNASPPYSHEDYIRDEIDARLMPEDRRIVKEFDEADDPCEHRISEADARTMCNRLLRLLGRRPA